jgi:glycosyltransferase involved in cell wall biosynthesis
MKVSVCLSTHERPAALRNTLASIVCQQPPFDYEVIVCDDGSRNRSASEVCREFNGIQCFRIEREPVYRNPSRGRNLAYRHACGEIIVAQSDDVIHSHDAIQRLVDELEAGRFVIATVLNCVPPGHEPNVSDLCVFTGPTNRRPFFFLGALYRKDLYAVGGNDEDFIYPAYDDDWFGDCLINGLGLKPHFSLVEGYHQDHSRPFNIIASVVLSERTYREKVAAAQSGLIPWKAKGGAWKYQ